MRPWQSWKQRYRRLLWAISIMWALPRPMMCTVGRIGLENQGRWQEPPGQDAAAPRMLSFSLPASGWAGSGPYTCAISEASATANTAVVECVLTAATRANQLADIDWTTSAGSIALSTTVKPTGELAGYMILTEVQ